MPCPPGYARFPAVRGETLVFVADDDLWIGSTGGGLARRLTADHAPLNDPKLSPDGTLVAYAGKRDGPSEVYVVGTDGSPVRRLTYWADTMTRVIGWADDDRVIAISAVGAPFPSRTWAYALPVGGGTPARLPYGPITGLAKGPAGAVVLGVNQLARRAASWKRYRGGTAPALWIDRDGGGSFEPYLRDLDGQLEDPAWVADRVLFVSDHEGVGNIYTAAPDGSAVQRHTDHAEFYARAASTDGQTVVYQLAGEIWRLDDLAPDSEPRRIELELGSAPAGRTLRRLLAADELGEYSPDHSGRASAVEVRGSIHWLTHRDGPALALAGGAGVRCRLPKALSGGDDMQAVYVTDAVGDDALELASTAGARSEPPRRIGAGQIGRVLALAVAPGGNHAAAATHDGRVIVIDLASGELRTLDHSRDGDASGLSFSPDSRWLAWSRAGHPPLRNIRLGRVDGTETLDATPLRFQDNDPVFTLDGKYLAFLSARTFDPVYDAHVFDMSFAVATRPYLLPLAAATPSPFDPELAGRARGAAPADAAPATAKAADDAGADPPSTTVDPEGLGERVVPVPVDAGRHVRLRAVAGGLTWMVEPERGVLGEDRVSGSEAPRPKLVRYDLGKTRLLDLVAQLDSYEAAGDGRSLAVRDVKALRIVPADRKVEPPSPGAEPDPEDWLAVDLSRIRVELDPLAEWHQMYDETARLMRDHFWIEDMGGVDWDEVVARYRPLVDRIATRDDLSEVIWDLQGELGSSHAYEMLPPKPPGEECRLGRLGADVSPDADGAWRVERILPGETSVPAARSPLSAPGIAIRSGDVIVAVDGHVVQPDAGPSPLLVGAAEKPVELTVRSADTGEIRHVVVTPLADERPLRYQDWVADRRAVVHAATDGRIGYLHSPDMIASGWAQLHRDLRVEVAKDGLIVDVRDNRGGHVSELVLEKLARTVRAWETARHKRPGTYPNDSPRGPLVAIANEWAGSDGDIVTAGFRQRGIGPVVGTRTWGGVIGIDGRYHLVDGTVVTQPRYAFWFADGLGWGIENYGVDPDVEVRFAPQDWAEGRDPQLDRALQMVLEALAAHPAARPPDPATRPSRAVPPLPPRS
jgi:tricorn protease